MLAIVLLAILLPVPRVQAGGGPPPALWGNWPNLASVGGRSYLSMVSADRSAGTQVYLSELDADLAPTGRWTRVSSGAARATDHRMVPTLDGRLFTCWSGPGDRTLDAALVDVGREVRVRRAASVATGGEPTNDMLIGAGPARLYLGTFHVEPGQPSGHRIYELDDGLSVVRTFVLNDVPHTNGASLTWDYGTWYLAASTAPTPDGLVVMEYDGGWTLRGHHFVLQSSASLYWPSRLVSTTTGRWLAYVEGHRFLDYGRVWLTRLDAQWKAAATLLVSAPEERAARPCLVQDRGRLVVSYDRMLPDGRVEVVMRPMPL